ncbi:Nucleolar protein-like protein [Emericellopsis cladophorae]|uniref:Nucleolar protein-like protein n=1 Tax=Emericellopsis cladophorae TaxID=2686198 RepID=A0A9Q0BDS3_9HYPO|nr:Nucleolar protein-like protein [Emericellopsis cladophorae]KAI6781672.1 Nucleolar protein-like protein [Emericellopsis cladophorae]
MSNKEEKRARKAAKAAAEQMPETQPDTTMANTTDSTTPSKRKASVEELEVDLAAPEPPSKRAKRALKKGKSATAPKKRDDDRDLTKDDLEDDAPKEQPRGEHGVWIGNLRFTVTPQELKQWLVENSGGVVTEEGITRVKLPMNKDKGDGYGARNKGFAYVDFSDLGQKVAAIALSETEWIGRKLLIKDSTSYEGRPAKPAEGAEELQDQNDAFKKVAEASRKIFVGNMSFQTTEEDVYRQFEKCGEIEFVKVAQFEDSGKCKGYGWVKFKDPEAAAWAVKGFVKLREPIETEEDFNEDSGDEEERENKRKYKTTKWWVNRMLGRELKLELAEDDASRYKKRFGKDAPKDGDGKPVQPKRENGPGRAHRKDAVGGKPMREAQDIDVARLTGAVVKSTGTKVTFD